MTEPLWTIEDIRQFLAVESQTTAYKVAARPDAPEMRAASSGSRSTTRAPWRSRGFRRSSTPISSPGLLAIRAWIRSWFIFERQPRT